MIKGLLKRKSVLFAVYLTPLAATRVKSVELRLIIAYTEGYPVKSQLVGLRWNLIDIMVLSSL